MEMIDSIYRDFYDFDAEDEYLYIEKPKNNYSKKLGIFKNLFLIYFVYMSFRHKYILLQKHDSS